MGLGASVVANGNEIEGITEVEVLEAAGRPTRFRVRVDLPIADSDYPALADGDLSAGAELSVMVADQCLALGTVTGQKARLGGSVGEESWLDVHGYDNSIKMGREARLSAWTLLTESDVVTAIVAGYGFVPDVETTSTRYSPMTHELIQRGSDLEFVQRLARRNGYLFWISADTLGIQTAHFRRPPVDAGEELTLSIHLDESSFDVLEIEWDAERPHSVVSAGLDVSTLSTIDGSVTAPPLPSMASTGLAQIADPAHSTLVLAPADDAGGLTARSEAALVDAEMFVKARGTTTLARAGSPVRAHTVVALDGVGSRHSGPWFVAGVRHLIDGVSHRMECELARNGWEG